MLRKKIVPPMAVSYAEHQPFTQQFAHWLPDPERIVGLGFRYWTHGLKSGDIASWEHAWNLYCGLFGVCGAREAVGNLSDWVNALNQAAVREIEVFSQACPGFCRDECIAIGMIAASQHKTCPAMRACAYALIEASGVDDVVDGAKAFADTLMSLDQVLSPNSIVTTLALVSPVNGYSHQRGGEEALMPKHELIQAMAQLDGHFAPDDASPADAGSWVTVRWYLIRMLDGLGLARLELESGVRSPEEQVRMALRHVRFGLGEAGQ